MFLKLYIAKAYDIVRWDYLLEVLEQYGFEPHWRGWVFALLSTTSTAILLNGAMGRWFKHFAGLRQGDPLSPLLFILVMEPLQRLLELATKEQLLSPVNNSAIKLRASLYVDDAAILQHILNPDLRHFWTCFWPSYQSV
jgi:hypothetical protein